MLRRWCIQCCIGAFIAAKDRISMHKLIKKMQYIFTYGSNIYSKHVNHTRRHALHDLTYGKAQLRVAELQCELLESIRFDTGTVRC